MQTRQHGDETLLMGKQSSNHIVVIGAGVGGPQALAVVLDDLPRDFPGTVLIFANMGKGFTRVLADKLSFSSQMPVSVIKDGQILQSSTVLLTPTECTANIALNQDDPKTHIVILEPPIESPDAGQKLDTLMNSAVTMFGKHVIGVILTGVGNDGLVGANNIREAGGKVLVQDEASSICYGASGAVSAAGLANQVVPLWQMATVISSYSRLELVENAA
jgi:two-component system chemotaxis response regulator CheB